MNTSGVDSVLVELEGSLWGRFISDLRMKFTDQTFHTWFEGMSLHSYEGGNLQLLFDEEFALDWVRKHYRDVLLRHAAQIFPGFNSLAFSLNPCVASQNVADKPRETNEIPFTVQSAIQGVVESSPEVAQQPAGLNVNYTFENFVGQGGFHMAYTIAQEVARHPGQKSLNPLIIHGDTGLGKTHLATAIGNYCLENHTAKTIIFKTSEQFLSEFVGKIRGESARRSRTGYRTISDRDVMGMSKEVLSADLLIIDDIQFLAGKEKTQDHFCKILNSLMAMEKQVVVTCDKSPESFQAASGRRQKESLDERLLHKFRSGTSIEVSSLDAETREALLRRKIQDFRLAGYIPEEVIQLLSESPMANVRELEGVLNKLFAYKELMRRDVTIDMVRIILGDTTRNLNCNLSLEKITEVVAREMSITKEMIISMSRIQKAALPRKVAMYLCRELTDNSLHTIGLHFNRDYSTVIFNIKAFVTLLNRNQELAQKVRQLKEKLVQAY